MAKPKFNKFKEIYYDFDNYKTIQDIAAFYQVHRRTIFSWIKEFAAEGNKLKNRELKKSPKEEQKTAEELIEFKRLKDEIKFLEKRLEESQKLALGSKSLKNLIFDANIKYRKKNTSWMKAKNASKEKLLGIPTLFLSDIHFDEFVDPSQINYVNEYNHHIAVNRIRNTFDSSLRILHDFVAKPQYDGAVIALGGDLLSGNIHEELTETNDAPILSSIIELTQLLIDGISLFATHFKNVFVPCVVGNHGRLHKKPRFKNKVFENYEWLIYNLLEKHFLDNDRVSFLIPDGPDAIFNIYDKTFLLTHGDQFRGGSGISGIMTPLHLGMHRKQKKQAAIHQSFDVMMLGHFHQYIHTNSMIVNGSIKGYDEFANGCNFAWEPAQQALFINHPQYGMIFRTPVLCDKKPEIKPQQKIEVFK